MVSNVEFRKPKNAKSGSKVKAEVSFILHDAVLLSGKIIQGPRGLFIGYLSEKRDGEYKPIVDIVKDDLRWKVQELVLKEWEASQK